MLGFTSCRWIWDSKKKHVQSWKPHETHTQPPFATWYFKILSTFNGFQYAKIIPGARISKSNGLSTPTWWIGFLQGGHSWMLVFHVTINLPKQILYIYISIYQYIMYPFQVRDPSVYRYMISCDLSRSISALIRSGSCLSYTVGHVWVWTPYPSQKYSIVRLNNIFVQDHLVPCLVKLNTT